MKDKRFDCVKMKWDIQQRIRKEFEGIPGAQAREMQMQQVAEDPILGPFYRCLMSKKSVKKE